MKKNNPVIFPNKIHRNLCWQNMKKKNKNIYMGIYGGTIPQIFPIMVHISGKMENYWKTHK